MKRGEELMMHGEGLTIVIKGTQLKCVPKCLLNFNL